MPFSDGSWTGASYMQDMRVREFSQGTLLGVEPGYPKLVVSSIDFGRDLVLLRDFGSHQIWRAAGGKYWDGIGSTSYVPTRYYLIKVLIWDAEWFRAKCLREAEPGLFHSRLIGSWMEHLIELGAI